MVAAAATSLLLLSAAPTAAATDCLEATTPILAGAASGGEQGADRFDRLVIDAAGCGDAQVVARIVHVPGSLAVPHQLVTGRTVDGYAELPLIAPLTLEQVAHIEVAVLEPVDVETHVGDPTRGPGSQDREVEVLGEVLTREEFLAAAFADERPGVGWTDSDPTTVLLAGMLSMLGFAALLWIRRSAA